VGSATSNSMLSMLVMWQLMRCRGQPEALDALPCPSYT
jgi:hypothetical protein